MKNSINDFLIAIFFVFTFLIFFTGCAATAPGGGLPPNSEGNVYPEIENTPYASFDFVWNEDDGGYYVYERDSNPYCDIVIPSEYNGKAVIGIGKHAFGAYSKVRNVIVPDSVKFIDVQAFNYCDYLESITFSKNSGLVEIRDYAFYNCKSLERLNIPANVEKIGYRAFSTCPSLVDLTVEESNKNYCSENSAIYTKDMKTLVTVAPASYISGEIVPGGEASMSSLIIHDGIEVIGAGAFADCDNLEAVVIPDSVILIQKCAFMSCDNLKQVVFGENSSLVEIGEGAFRECDSLEEINIPKGVVTIGRYAFYCDSALIKFNYASSIEAWDAIEKGEKWDVNTGYYTVFCMDGTVDKE